MEIPYPESGLVTGLAAEGSVLHAATATGRLFLSRDGGGMWTAQGSIVGPGEASPVPIRSLLAANRTRFAGAVLQYNLAPGEESRLCNLSEEPGCPRDPTAHGGLWYSRTEGIWNSVLLERGARPGGVSALTQTGPWVYAASSRGVYLHNTGKGPWEWQSLNGPQDAPAYSPRYGRNTVLALEAAADALFALTDSALYVAVLDPGSGRPEGPFAEHPMRARDLAVIGPWVLVAASDGIRRTADGGRTWETLGGGAFSILETREGILHGVRGAEILRSADTGRSWTSAADAGSHGPALLLDAGPRLLAAYPGRVGLFQVTPGEAPTPIGHGLRENAARALLLAGGHLWAAGDLHGAWLGRPSPAGTWTQQAEGVRLLGLAGETGGGIFAAGKGIWSLRPGGAAPAQRDSAFSDSVFLFAASGEDFQAAATTRTLVRCRDGLAACEDIGSAFLAPDRQGAPITSLAARGATMVVGADRLYVSGDKGATWSARSAHGPGEYRYGFLGPRLARFYRNVWPKHYDKLTVSLSSDLGATWTHLPVLDGKEGLYAFAGDEGTVWLGTGTGLFRRSLEPGDSAATWNREEASGLPPGLLLSLALEGNTLVAAHQNGRMYVLDLRTIGIAPAKARGRGAARWQAQPGRYLDAAGRLRALDGRARP